MITPRGVAVAAGIAALAVGAAVLAIVYPAVVAGVVVAVCLAGGMAQQAVAERQKNRNGAGKDADTPSRERTDAPPRVDWTVRLG
jgi:hypothetical protein